MLSDANRGESTMRSAHGRTLFLERVSRGWSGSDLRRTVNSNTTGNSVKSSVRTNRTHLGSTALHSRIRTPHPVQHRRVDGDSRAPLPARLRHQFDEAALADLEDVPGERRSGDLLIGELRAIELDRPLRQQPTGLANR